MGFERIVLLPKAMNVQILNELRNKTYNNMRSFKERVIKYSKVYPCDTDENFEDLLNDIKVMSIDAYIDFINYGNYFYNYWVISVTLNILPINSLKL